MLFFEMVKFIDRQLFDLFLQMFLILHKTDHITSLIEI